MPSDFTPDCDNCAALCCIMMAFDKGDAFAIDKPAGIPCPHLSGRRCTIHDRLDDEGFPGCSSYDCLGAGQMTTALFAASWQDEPALAGPMADAFRRLRAIQEIRAQLAAAPGHFDDADIAREIGALETRLTTDWSADSLSAFDMTAARRSFQDILSRLRELAEQ